VDTITDVSKPTLSGVARVLVHGGKLAAARAEELVRSAKEKKVSFISELMGSGELSPAQLAHALSALAIPCWTWMRWMSSACPRTSSTPS
jgi:type IV pilus assembly protein PilB